jgi:hypothetical protein
MQIFEILSDTKARIGENLLKLHTCLDRGSNRYVIEGTADWSQEHAQILPPRMLQALHPMDLPNGLHLSIENIHKGLFSAYLANIFFLTVEKNSDKVTMAVSMSFKHRDWHLPESLLSFLEAYALLLSARSPAGMRVTRTATDSGFLVECLLHARTDVDLFATFENAADHCLSRYRECLAERYRAPQLGAVLQGPRTEVALGQGSVFDYFDQVRRVIKTARSDVLFVDPYLEAEFVARYLPLVPAGVPIRLLAREKLPSLLPAVALLGQQSGTNIEVRAAGGFHDRYVLIDKASAYHSGASFKDGAKTAPTTLTQVVDAFQPVHETYEQIWAGATVHR